MPYPLAAAGAFATPAAGFRTALPVIFAYLPLGFAAGVVGARAGLSPAEVTLLSLLVFAGVAQFIFADMVGGSALALITTIAMVNFRHFLYSTALTPKLKHLPKKTRAAIGAQLTDESFALISLLYQPHPNAAGVLTLNLSCYLAWLCGNVAGAIVGDAGGLGALGADYLLIAMFAALLMLKITAAKRKSGAVMALVIAAVLSVGLELYHSHPLNILVSAGAAAAAAAMVFKGRREDLIAAEDITS